MDENTYQLLTGLLDGSLSPDEERRARDLLERSDEARRFVAEHRALWEELGRAFDDAAATSDPAFRARTLAAAQMSEPRRSTLSLRRIASVAALLLVAVSLYLTRDLGRELSREDREMVQYLHVLQHFDLIQTRGEQLDLRYDLDVLRAFEGEGEGEG